MVGFTLFHLFNLRQLRQQHLLSLLFRLMLVYLDPPCSPPASP